MGVVRTFLQFSGDVHVKYVTHVTSEGPLPFSQRYSTNFGKTTAKPNSHQIWLALPMALPIAPVLPFKLISIARSCKPPLITCCLAAPLLQHVCLNTSFSTAWRPRLFVAQAGVDATSCISNKHSAAQDMAWAESSLLAATARRGKRFISTSTPGESEGSPLIDAILCAWTISNRFQTKGQCYSCAMYVTLYLR